MDHLSHADHNFNACSFLKGNGNFNDWVVTTSFYSCMHYVYYKSFPNNHTIKGTTKHYDTFSQFYKDFHKHNPKVSRHDLTVDLAIEIFPEEISVGFHKLKSDCMNARYHNYNISQIIVDSSVSVLESIRQLCAVTVQSN